MVEFKAGICGVLELSPNTLSSSAALCIYSPEGPSIRPPDLSVDTPLWGREYIRGPMMLQLKISSEQASPGTSDGQTSRFCGQITMKTSIGEAAMGLRGE